jgi:hypothetical protein
MVIIRRRALAAVCGGLLMLLTACTPSTANPAPTPSTSAPDFTEPGVAQSMIQQLLTSAGSTKALMVTVTADTAEVTTLNAEQPVTWAYRDGKVAKVASDLQYVDQATFDASKFNLADVGALFRAAAGQSGSSDNQTLTIVDNSGGEVVMSVSTEPESRTVFFTPDGALTEILDFDTLDGITSGIKDAIGGRALVYSVTVISDQGVSAEFAGTNATTIRRTRGSRVPTIATVRSTANLRQFAAGRVSASTIWRVVEKVRGTDDATNQSKWSVTIDNRENLTLPRMHFTFGFTVVVTDLDGNIISQ